MPICDRCGNGVTVTIMSMFNDETICLECKAKEKEHPDYEKAHQAEIAANKAGDFNFPGVGKPEDL